MMLNPYQFKNRRSRPPGRSDSVSSIMSAIIVSPVEPVMLIHPLSAYFPNNNDADSGLSWHHALLTRSEWDSTVLTPLSSVRSTIFIREDQDRCTSIS